MREWRTVLLGDALEFSYGKSLPKMRRSSVGAIPVYGSNGIAGWHDEAIVLGPTVIVGRKGSAGAVHYVDRPCYPIDTTYFVRPRDGFEFDIKFLFYLLRRLDLGRLRTATGVPGLTRNDVYKERIPVPTIEEQHRIVDLLSRAEGIVRLRREAQKKAAAIIPALFLDMFGDPTVNEMNWPVQRLDQVATISYGIADKLNSSVTAERGTRILTISNVLLDGSIDMSVERYSAATEAQHNKASVQRGDLLFNWRNGSEHHIGKTAMWEGDNVVLHVSFLLRLRPNQNLALPHYLWAMLNRLRSAGFFIGASRQQINRKFNASELSALKIPIAPIDVQKSFANFSECGRALLTQQIAATSRAEAAFQALLARIFSESQAALKGRVTTEEGLLV